MIQRKTQTEHFWQKQFTVSDKDLEAIYNQILELGQPLHLDQIAVDLVKRYCDAEELEARSELQQGKLYQPKESFSVKDKVVFSAFEFAVGTVVSMREGHHPDYGSFTVIAVEFNNNIQGIREFAANFKQDHLLNASDQSLANLQGLLSPDELYQTFNQPISSKLRTALDNHDDFVEFHDQYFLADLITEFNEGLFNIADAAIDINQGPLSIDALIEQMRLVEDGQETTDLLRFSVSYHLAHDERFDDVGPTGQVLWYLERMAPPEAHHPPRRLQVEPQSYDVTKFDDNLRHFLTEIDDELTDPQDFGEVDPNPDSVVITLNYPHQRVGTLPLTPKTLPLFSTSYYNPVLFEFVDGRTGNTFPGWCILNHKYIFGLDNWYKKNKLPVGAYITLKRTDDPMRVIVDYQATRTQRDWVRQANVAGNKLTFQMSPSAYGCEYDDLMIIGESSTSQLDSFWLKAVERDISLFNLMCQIFPELSKLNPQSTVHAKTLYSGINVIRRAAPGIVFQELVTNDCFIPMDHGYWTYDPNLRD